MDLPIHQLPAPSFPIPALVLTARGEAAESRRPLALGPRRSRDDPYDAGALIAEVRRHLGSRDRARHAAL